MIIGGTGYVGSKLAPKLLEDGYDVTVADWMMYGNHLPFDRNLRCVKTDIRDREGVEGLFETGYDAVVMLASISNDPMGDLNPKLTESINVDATENIIDLCVGKGVPRFIFASSSSVYGVNDQENITEDVPTAPISLYSRTKEWVEDYLREKSSDSFQPTIVRPATVCGYSPRQRLDLIVNLLAYKAYFDGGITIEGGERIRPHIHVDDMVCVYQSLLEAPEEKVAGMTFNCGAEIMSLLELGEKVQKHTGCKLGEAEGPDKRSHRLNSDLIKETLDIKFTKTVDDAISDLIWAFENHLADPSDGRLFNLKWYNYLLDKGSISL